MSILYLFIFYSSLFILQQKRRKVVKCENDQSPKELRLRPCSVIIQELLLLLLLLWDLFGCTFFQEEEPVCFSFITHAQRNISGTFALESRENAQVDKHFLITIETQVCAKGSHLGPLDALQHHFRAGREENSKTIRTGSLCGHSWTLCHIIQGVININITRQRVWVWYKRTSCRFRAGGRPSAAQRSSNHENHTTWRQTFFFIF